MAHRAEGRNWGWFWFGLLLTVALLVLGWSVYDRSDPAPAAAASSTTAARSLPPACLDALALASVLADDVGPLVHAANGHVNIMELLKLTLDGKPGGIDGHEAFRRSEPQMAAMAKYGPDAQVEVRRLRAKLKACPLA